MKNIATIFLLLGALLHTAAEAPTGIYHRGAAPQKRDTIVKVTPRREGEVRVRNKMSTSSYPVQLDVVGSAIRVESPRSQILPIYTGNGTFYVFMRLNKGVNWLNGLPKGRYFINNRLLVIK